MGDSFIYLGKSFFWYNVDIKAELVTDTNILITWIGYRTSEAQVDDYFEVYL